MKLKTVKKENTETFSFRISSELLKAFKAICEGLQIKPAEGLRQLVEDYVRGEQNETK